MQKLRSCLFMFILLFKVGLCQLDFGSSSGEPSIEDGIGSAYTRPDLDGVHWTVLLAGSTFHTIVHVRKGGPLAFHLKDPMGTDDNTETTHHTFFRIICEIDYPLYILIWLHN